MTLIERRKAIRHLLNQSEPADASAVYYAFHHPEKQVQIKTYPADGSKSSGFVCSAMTGIDLFHPLVTMRLPLINSSQEIDFSSALELIYSTLPVGAPVIISTLNSYFPLLGAIFDIHREDKLRLLALDQQSFSPLINVLVTESPSYNNLPRYVIRSNTMSSGAPSGEVIASAGVNWQSPSFAEIYVNTIDHFRRQGMGKSVVAYVVQRILDSGRAPLYVVSTDNGPSFELASSVGFLDTGVEEILIEAALKPRPLSVQ